MISLLDLLFRDRTIAASMAIGRPQAIDDASRATAASAEDGSRGSFLFREEWRRSRQGKKVNRRHCGIGDRGAAALRPDQAMERPFGAVDQQSENKETVAIPLPE
tara:strand:+ start:158 stop:472 length:315 start_codon:yes stop_codon:yes gene_type:complete